jgi:hypothetical protein
MRRLWAYLFAVLSATVSWQPWQPLPGVFDLAGPRSDGRLVAAAGGRLFLVAADGAITPFADGQGGYQVASGPEAYLDVSPGLHVVGANCDFARDDVFVIRPTAPIGITRVDPQGHATNFVDLTGVDSLSGIVFDTVGRFDHRLLVSGPHNQHSTIVAVDCKGAIVTITNSAPPVEGGFAVAPTGFGTHAGDLVAPDENTGAIWAVSATGRSELLVASGIPHGGDIGVESAAFVPAGFTRNGGAAYISDRATANNPHAGTDNILRISSSDLMAAGVRDGDLVVVAEGGAVTIDVRCAPSCTSTAIVPAGTSAHIEGHLVIIANQPRPAAPSLPAVADLGSQRAQLLIRLAVGAVIAAALAALVVLMARRTRRR